ncbi:MAG: ORF6N domain-containing protein [Patescibacteria group bacterium]|nr:ORF6N domain-containing protein [Patescibacteria group bacterium]MEA3501073.1 ORF6N domain-containing protein [Candidatus Neomarinimicrobiota bacterium]
MSENKQIITTENIQNQIYTIRGVQVMLDSDLAEMYQVETKNLNRAVSRNIDRFPEKFRFQLTQDEYDEYEKSLRFQFGTLENNNDSLRSQKATLEKGRGKHRKYLPYVFTEQGVSMLSAILRSETAIKVSIQIIDAFVEMRKFLLINANLFKRLSNVEQKQISSDIKQIKTEEKIERILDAIESKEIKPKQGIFYDGQVFDAYIFIADLIKSAKKSILLIDNYIDESVLQLFTKRNKNVSINIYTKNITKILKQDLKKHNSQHPKIEIKQFDKAHDRFLIIDNSELYHFGASLKDLGKKWFAFSKMDMKAMEMIANLKNGGGDE